MSRCGCSSQCSCAVVGSENITVTGTGAPANPYVISADAGGALQVTDTPTVDLTLLGSGTASDPHILSAAARISGTAGNLLSEHPDGLAVTCEDVQDCVGQALADGLEYDDANTIRARVSGQAGNSLSIGPDGGLYAPQGGGNPVVVGDSACIGMDGDGAGTPLTASPILDPAAGNLLACEGGGLRASLDTGCGLAGDGSPAAPLSAAVQAWPYDCDMDAAAGGVYCDSNGVLRSEPRPLAFFVEDHVNQTYPDLAVPAAPYTPAATRTLEVTNPDPCREAFVIVETELDIDFSLPAGASASGAYGGDEVQRFVNTGNALAHDVHCQMTKVYHATVAAGATQNIEMEVGIGRGSGGATYNRIQTFIRAFVFVL